MVAVRWPSGVDAATVASLARAHHRPSSVEEVIVQQADCLSAGQDRPGSDGDTPVPAGGLRSTPLLSVFESLAEGGRGRRSFAHPMAPLGEDLAATFPVPQEESGQKLTPSYAELLAGFIKVTESLQAETPDVLVAAMTTALYRFTWCLPASTIDLPDVSLYDHLKSTAALAACLHSACMERKCLTETAARDRSAPYFLVVAGYLSGIQDYLFDIAEVGVGGTAKRLRARSFYLGLIAEIAAMRLLRAFSVTPVNMLMCSGGRFTLLLPNLNDASERIARVRASLDRWLHDTLHGQVHINVAHVVASGSEFMAGNFGRLLDRLEMRMQQAKRRPLAAVLQPAEQWSDTAFMPGRLPGNATYRPCQYCGKLPASHEDERARRTCTLCDQDVRLGRRLTTARLAVIFDDERRGEFKAVENSFGVLESGYPPGDASWALAINDFDAPFQARQAPVWHRFFANTIPRPGPEGCSQCQGRDNCVIPDDERPAPGGAKTFACLSRLATGRNALAWLKGDVDNLGRTFAFGFPEPMRSVSRIATLSRMLDLFFGGWMNHLLETEFPNTYTVFSGGDDFLLVGPWSQMVELADELRRAFERFTCGRLTFSSGYALAGSGTPVASAAPMVERCLERAKEERAFGAAEGRDQIHVFGTTLKWQRFPAAVAEADKLAHWLSAGVVTVSAARRLLTYAEMWARFRRTGETANLRFIPLLAYDITRNWPDTSPEASAARQWVARFRNVEEPAFHGLRFVLEYALNTQR